MNPSIATPLLSAGVGSKAVVVEMVQPLSATARNVLFGNPMRGSAVASLVILHAS